jgi:hypothetical protein
MELREGDKANFNTLLKAVRNNDIALMSAVRKSDDKVVALVCAMGYDGTHYYPTPLAVMVEGNPYKLFEDPTEKRRSKPRPRPKKVNNRYLEV